MVTGRTDKTLQASRGTYKTTCVSFALALIAILLPNKRTLFMRKTDADVKEVIKQVQKILTDPHTQVFVNAIYDVNLKLTTQSATEVSTNLTTDIKGTGQLLGIGMGSSLTGKHYDYIFTDDIVNISDRISRAERERTKLIYQELQNVKNRDGKIFNTGTPWHKDDCFTIMPNAEKYDCYHEDVRKIISDEELQELKSSMTTSLFAANYELKHVADDDVIFTDPVVDADISMIRNGTSHCDAAFYGEDYTAFTICAIHDGKYYVYGRCWRKHIDDVIDECVMLHNDNLCGKLMIEKNADKGYVAKEFKNRGVRVYAYNESQNKYVKITTYLKFEWDNIVFVKGTDEEYIQQILDYNENAEHDDAPDSLASICRLMYSKGDEDQRRIPRMYGG
jgi:predicted phage terminase large subunit-like protein